MDHFGTVRVAIYHLACLLRTFKNKVGYTLVYAFLVVSIS